MPKYTNEQFAAAIRGSGGIIATIAGRVGCDWHTAEKRIRTSPTLAWLYEDEASKIDDLAESVVIKAMQEGDTNVAKWWLERRRRAKFATRVETEVSGPDGGPVEHVVEHRERLLADVERKAAGYAAGDAG